MCEAVLTRICGKEVILSVSLVEPSLVVVAAAPDMRRNLLVGAVHASLRCYHSELLLASRATERDAKTQKSVLPKSGPLPSVTPRDSTRRL